ncbi:DarT ssDNA thymidine ADP-ribosyltransferase family protein [Butyrivibrio hungatei]|uniref:DarT ssDNA thymidine ADP-ribosyltransferase family protein n=1 Tax=Butyrivibrio hungatei TaxID=185008 RepID=UPI00040272B8|nr:DarT ssDNA thymidine ADP-ribosyltransferase family protein [Butyrivibrio hungatei]
MYSEIIKKNFDRSYVRWWPRYAYHYTDISNAVGILTSGRIYSRINAGNLKLMKNDNASRQVIDMTSPEITSYVRFYFRPLTPTQFHNEGFKHYKLRYDGDTNANVPVPVFLIFDLNKLLSDPNTQFSGISQAGYGTTMYNTVSDFEKLDFDRIYGGGVPLKEDVAYRHAEIVCHEYYEIDKSIVGIACRNEVEKQTLCNMLWEKNHRTFYKYKEMIKVMKDDMFESNGLFISDCDYHGDSLGIRFSNTKSKRDYLHRAMKQNPEIDIDSLQVSMRVVFDWMTRNGGLYHREITRSIDYNDTQTIVVSKIPVIRGAKELWVRIDIEEKNMSFLKYQLGAGEVL